MSDAQITPSEMDIDIVVVRLAQQRERAGELIQIAASVLQCSVSQVERFVQNRYPGLLIKPSPERKTSLERPAPIERKRQKIKAKSGDVFSLPARKRQGGHTF